MPINTSLAVICPAFRVSPGSLCIVMPGGAEICVGADIGAPNAMATVKKLFDVLNSALAPLVPIFNILDVLFALKDCMTAIPKSIAQLNPGPVLDCLEELAKKLAQIAKMLPQVSIPVMLVMFLDAIIAFFAGYLAEFESLTRQLEAIVASRTRAQELGNVGLLALLECVETNINIEAENLGSAAEPLNRLIGVVNGLLDLAGLPCIPAAPSIAALTDEALDPLREFLDLLRALRQSIPVPDWMFDPSFSKPCED